MNTKLIMTSTAILMAAVGISLIFAADNVIELFGMNKSIELGLMFQLLGAAYYAFAMLNWMAKGAIVGGIYNRPIVVANLSHFLIAGLALTKAVLSNDQMPLILWIMTGVYVFLAGVFAVVMSTHPGSKAN
jgi:hypothetical protein